jgi:threonine synthase
MNYYSTNRISPQADFKTATIQGQAPDKGLYFPAYIPELSEAFIQNIGSYSNEAIAYEVIKPYVGDSIQEKVLQDIVEETVNFQIPLVPINDRIASLELFHGPTLAFKDVGARFMSRCLAQFVKGGDRKITILVATSGDTGGAVANGFYDVPGIEVVILYPSGKVSKVQEQQLTTLGKNIHALEVNGTFDDCQRMVKEVFSDADQFPNLFLTSANSINVARWLPQQFYYFFAYKQWEDQSMPPVISVPSGNFGNICAGLLANASGLPVQHFIAACNANDVVPHYLLTGEYKVKNSVATISNAMDVANPSNFVRIMEIFDQHFSHLREKLSAYSISDEETRSTIKRIYNEYHYLLDPHGAVGYTALEKYLSEHPSQKGILLETAHPVKFYDVVEWVIGESVPMPTLVQEQLKLEKNSTLIDSDLLQLTTFLRRL